jgi:hypothetical protein
MEEFLKDVFPGELQEPARRADFVKDIFSQKGDHTEEGERPKSGSSKEALGEAESAYVRIRTEPQVREEDHSPALHSENIYTSKNNEDFNSQAMAGLRHEGYMTQLWRERTAEAEKLRFNPNA